MGCSITRRSKLFEAIILDGLQAGLSWFNILKKEKISERPLASLTLLKLLLTQKKILIA
jgi:3-methyladenine DNA glycosylase Tag